MPAIKQRAQQTILLPKAVKLAQNDDVESGDFGTWSYEIIGHDDRVLASNDGYLNRYNAEARAMNRIAEGFD